MFLALGVASAIEFFMYIVFLLVIKDPATLTDSASPIAYLFAQQVSPWFSKLVIALVFFAHPRGVLAIMLVATRLVVCPRQKQHASRIATAASGFDSSIRCRRSAVLVTGLVSTGAPTLGARQRANIRVHHRNVGSRILQRVSPYNCWAAGGQRAQTHSRWYRGNLPPRPVPVADLHLGLSCVRIGDVSAAVAPRLSGQCSRFCSDNGGGRRLVATCPSGAHRPFGGGAEVRSRDRGT